MDLDQIQGNIVPGFHKDHQAFLFIRFPGPAQARAWLEGLRPCLASARDVHDFKVLFKRLRARAPHPEERDAGALRHLSATWLNVALSFTGLTAVAGRPARRFPATFQRGQVPGAAVSIDADALLIVAADHARDLDAEVTWQRQHLAEQGIQLLECLRGDTLPGSQRGHEHFGFKDGVSQPHIAGTRWGDGAEVAPGEFVLGLPDESGVPGGVDLPVWAQNGSFLAFVQLQQHVDTFWRAMRDNAQQLGLDSSALANAIVGRTEAGELLTAPPANVSHIGRAYSRWLPPSESQRHRILRRGIPYGPPLAGEPDGHATRGLLFVAYQSDIERQFEYVWRHWLNAAGFPLPDTGADALAGQRTQPDGSHGTEWHASAMRPAVSAHPGEKGGLLQLRLPVFVTPLLGGYFFAPALDFLSRLTDAPASS